MEKDDAVKEMKGGKMSFGKRMAALRGKKKGRGKGRGKKSSR